MAVNISKQFGTWLRVGVNEQQPFTAGDGAPQLRARPIWFTGSKTTVAPAVRAMSAVRSAELLSQTMSSEAKPAVVNAARRG